MISEARRCRYLIPWTLLGVLVGCGTGTIYGGPDLDAQSPTDAVGLHDGAPADGATSSDGQTPDAAPPGLPGLWAGIRATFRRSRAACAAWR